MTGYIEISRRLIFDVSCRTLCYRRSKTPNVCIEWYASKDDENYRAASRNRANHDPLQAPVYLSRKELSSLADQLGLTDDLYLTEPQYNNQEQNQDEDQEQGQEQEQEQEQEQDDDFIDDSYEKRKLLLLSQSNPLFGEPSDGGINQSEQQKLALYQLNRLQQILSSFKNMPRPYSTGKHLLNPPNYQRIQHQVDVVYLCCIPRAYCILDVIKTVHSYDPYAIFLCYFDSKLNNVYQCIAARKKQAMNSK